MQIIPVNINKMASHCDRVSFSLYMNLPYRATTMGLENVRVAIMLTSYIFMPKLKNNVPMTPKKATKKIYVKITGFGISKEVFEIFRWMPLYNNIPHSMMNVVRIGPITITGILKRKYMSPHNKQVIKACGIPLEVLRKWEFFKSLKFIEISVMPEIIRRTENACIADKDSLKKIIENRIVNITEEFKQIF